MTCVPRSDCAPFAKFLRTFQSKAALIAFSMASEPPSTKNMCLASDGGMATRAKVSTNSAM